MSETDTAARADEAKEAPANVAPIRAPKRIHPSRFRQAEGARNTWSVVPEAGTPLSVVLDPDYWAHNAGKMRPNDRIEVDAEDGAYTATLFVRAVSRLSATVALLSKHEFDPLDAKPVADDFKVMWKGPMQKHAVVRVSDEKTILQGGFDTKEAALQWLAMNARSLAA